MMSFCNHSDFVAEQLAAEALPASERQKLARKKRMQQLKKFSQYEKQLEKGNSKKSKLKPEKRVDKKVKFVGNVMLLDAASQNDIEEVRHLLQMGVSPDVSNEDGLTALHQCCIDNMEEMLKLLIEFNANVNACDSELWTPLHAAATCGHVHLCRYLIDHGCDLLAVNADGNMPYDICEHEASLDLIESEMAKRGITQELIDETRLLREKQMLRDLEILAESGASLEFHGRSGETPLHIAAANGYMEVAGFLLNQASVHVDCMDYDSWQPIHCAACWGQLSVLELLLEHGADIEAKTRHGETPSDVCEDPELKYRISEIREQFQNKSIVRTQNFTRRHSSNVRSAHDSMTTLYSSNVSIIEKSPFSASVRRTSMREKKALSWKEAKEEGRMMRETPESMQNDDDEDEKLANNLNNASSVFHSPKEVRNGSQKGSANADGGTASLSSRQCGPTVQMTSNSADITLNSSTQIGNGAKKDSGSDADNKARAGITLVELKRQRTQKIHDRVDSEFSNFVIDENDESQRPLPANGNGTNSLKDERRPSVLKKTIPTSSSPNKTSRVDRKCCVIV